MMTSSPNQTSDLLRRLYRLIVGLWRKLTEPHPSIQEPERRSQAYLLSAVLLVLSLLTAIAILATSWFVYRSLNPFDQPLTTLGVVALGCMVLDYGLSRTAYHLLSASTLAYVILIMTLASIVIAPNIAFLPAFLPLSLVLGSLFLSRKGGIFLIIATLLGTLLLPAIITEWEKDDVVSALLVVVFFGVLNLVSTHIRTQFTQKIERQSHALTDELAERKQVEESLELFRTLVDQTNDAIEVVDPQTGRFLNGNRKAWQDLGYSRKEFLSLRVWDIDPTVSQSSFHAAFGEPRNSGFMWEGYHKRKDGSMFPVEVNIKHVQLDRAYVVTVVRDITERKRAEQRQAIQYAVAHALAESATLAEAASQFLQVICESLNWEAGELWGVDHKTNVLRYVGSWYAPGLEADEFAAYARQNVFAPGIGLPGQIWRTRQPAWLSDVVEEPNFPRAGFAARAGLHAGCGVPISLSSQILGVMVFFSRETRPPHDDLLAMMTAVGSQIGQFVARKQAEEALRESSERLTRLLAASPTAIYALKVEGDSAAPAWISENITRILGYSVEEALQPNWWLDHLYPEDRQRATEGLVHLFADDYHHEYRFVRKDGSVIWLQDQHRLLRDRDGIPTEVVGTWTDITERKQAEAFRSEQHQILELIARNAPLEDLLTRLVLLIESQAEGMLCSILFLDDDGVHLRHGAAPSLPVEYVRAIDGLPIGPQAGSCGTAMYRREQIIVTDILTDPLWEPYREFAAPFGLRACWSTPIISHEGKVLGSFAMYYRQVRSPGSAEMQLIQVATNIASIAIERRRAEEALRESEELYRLITDSSTDLIALADFQGGVVFVSPSIRQMMGLDPAQVIGMNAFSSIHPEDAPSSREAWARALTGETVTFMHRAQHANGTWRWLDGWGRVVQFQGQPHVLIVSRDITERMQAEEALRRRLAELEAVSRISATLRTAQTQGEMLPILLDETLAALESEAGAIWLYQLGNHELRVVVARGWFETLKESPIKPGEGIAGSVFVNGQAHLSHEFASDPLIHPSVIEQIPNGWGGVCIPIRAADSVGALFVSVPLPREITPEELKLLVSLAEIAGTALHRLRLHEETLRHLENLEALQTVDQAIIASLDSRVTLSILLEQVITQMHVDAAGVLLFNPQSLTLEYAAGSGFQTRNYERSRLRLGEGPTGRAALERRPLQILNPLESSDFVRAALLSSEGFVAYAALPFVAKGQLKGVLEVFHRTPLQPNAEWLNFLGTLAGQAAIAIDNFQLFESLQRSNTELTLAYDTTIEGWSRALDLRDRETEGHTLRVTEMTLRLARAAGMAENELVRVKRGALLHDIGKMGVPDRILHKKGPLTKKDWEIMRQHPQFAYEMLAPIAYLRPALDIPYCHHEKWDGTGYPRGLEGEQIPLAARLFAIADVWDALRSNRPYRPGWPEEKAHTYILEQAGRHFDPQTVELFFQVMQRKDMRT